jgi:hypothetical protein
VEGVISLLVNFDEAETHEMRIVSLPAMRYSIVESLAHWKEIFHG